MKVIKIGGNIIDNPAKLEKFLQDFAALKGSKILVHGGGKIATELSEKMGIKAQMVNGKRITDAETLKIVTMVYGGYINKNIVAKLQSLNCNAIGLTGADANLIPALKRIDANIDWGFVGDPIPEKLNLNTLLHFLKMGLQPVFCALTHDLNGHLLNTNADTLAATVAAALAKAGENVSLVYCFEKKGVLANVDDDNTLIKKITPNYYIELKQKGIVNQGMIPKLDNAFASVAQGVNEVKICMAEDLSDFDGAGTSIVANE